MMRGLPNDVYFKVGLLVIVGLSTKNAILIIEFAETLMDQGKGLIDATLEAVHLRLRPILMTSMAFVLGVLPLAISRGAARESERHRHGRDRRDDHGHAAGDLSGAGIFFVVRRVFKRRGSEGKPVAEGGHT